MSDLLQRFDAVDFSTPESQPIHSWCNNAAGAVSKVAFSPDAEYGAFLESPNRVVVFKFNVMTDPEAVETSHVDTFSLGCKVTFIAVAPKTIDTFLKGKNEDARREKFGPRIDDYILITGNARGKIAIWNIVSSMIITELSDHTDEITQIAYATNTMGMFQMISASLDGTLKIWDFLATHSVALPQTTSLPQALYSVSWSKLGSLVAAGCKNGAVYVFRMHQVLREKLLEFRNHNGACAVVQFAEDSSTLMSAGLDSRVNIWDCITGVLRQTFCHLLPVPLYVYHGTEIKQASLGRFGFKIITVTQNRKLSVWDTRNTRADLDLVNSLAIPCLFQEPQNGFRVQEEHSLIHGTESESVGFTIIKGGYLIAVTPLYSNKVEFYKSRMCVPTLSELCRDAVRAIAIDLKDGVHGLPIPMRLKSFLLYNDCFYSQEDT